MCGIVCGIARHDIVPDLLEGLRRLEYRGYDSAGIAVRLDDGRLHRVRALGKVMELARRLAAEPVTSHAGIGHTRWATHGAPSEANAHPHISRGELAVVHNGIIENHAALREAQRAAGFEFTSQTDTEVIGHQIRRHLDAGLDLFDAVRAAAAELHGAFAIGVLSGAEPDRLLAARRGSPLVVGVAADAVYLASDAAALVPFTQDMVFLQDGDVAEVGIGLLRIVDAHGQPVQRPLRRSSLSAAATERGAYRHYMQKEIFEQPQAIADTLDGRLGESRVLEAAFGTEAAAIFDRVRELRIVACGTSYHAGCVARYWFEALAGVPCQVEIASEFRYRDSVVPADALLVAISQSGETADTLEALREARRRGYAHTLAICNVPESSLTREADLKLMTHAGPEIGVASTKAFTTQLVSLMLLVLALGRRHRLDAATEASLVDELRRLPAAVQAVLALDDTIAALAPDFADKHHALFLGRGVHYPVALEGALKLKEISYIHAEAYAAGELKHGPLALVDADMPVVAVAPSDPLLEKLKSNMEEVRARGGRLLVFADAGAGFDDTDIALVEVPTDTIDHLVPVLFTVPLQLLAYHVALIRGTDVDQPRNLAKSVTVE
ncbi:glutamine--fructose-6-phosphate transaminase (isomerizing) [Immundisolibacter cernigliae]|uniref:Glutamine--fructose-6-phosphate aminotransferase [isomerizing] n=1 Tax=Immundisolibacter cernigliae TaxID=1810504 RepID=A0A1B1YSE3_9GAMM|nr:glutamine--fructose-6-phosphate transaminase (isomerizing) [Immundisolibacter cernigliae]ANX03800.1 glutamine--fructose-6-phosphate aminotransferase [Immundisolibacter cernigliae]